MDFAANAVADVIAPPTRTPNARPANAGGGRSFDDHLDRAAIEDAPEQPRPESASSDIRATPEQAPTDTAEDAPSQSDAPAQTAAPAETAAPVFIVQIVQPAPSQQPATVDLAGPPAAEPAQLGDNAGAPPVNADAADKAPTQGAKSDVAGGESEINQPQQSQPNAPASTPTPVQSQAASAPPAPALQSTPTSTPETAQIGSVAGALHQAPAPVTRETPQPRVAKADAPATKAEGQPLAKNEAPQAPQAKPAPASAQSFAPQNAEAKPAAPNAQAPLPADASAAQASAVLQASTTPTHAAQATSHVEHAARAAPASAQVAREIVRQFDGENTRFELRLDPPELGRVEVRLEVSRDNRVTAVVAADNPQALAELARHARDLEQMLQSSGLELTDNGLSFDLRQGGDSEADAGDGSNSNARGGDAEPETPTTQTSARPLGFERWRGVRVDIMA